MISSEEFASGLINFSPPDAIALAAVREDQTVRTYASKIKSLMGDANVENAQRQILTAMSECYQTSEMETKIETVFEAGSWLVKPLHYIPVAGEGLTIAEDLKGPVCKWLDLEVQDAEWYLLGAKMTDISIRDYLARKGNMLG